MSLLQCCCICQRTFSTITRSHVRNLFVRASPFLRTSRSSRTRPMKLLKHSGVTLSLSGIPLTLRAAELDTTTRQTKNQTTKDLEFKVVQYFVRPLYLFSTYTLRIIRVIVTFVPIICLYPLTFLSDKFLHLWWNILLIAVEFSGPTFIKFGQWASTRRDLFSAEFCNKFSKLYRRTRPHSWQYTEARLCQLFGRNWSNIFVDIDRVPVGSGCVAQVYKAWMPLSKIKDPFVLEDVLAECDKPKHKDYLQTIYPEAYGIEGFHEMFSSDDRESEAENMAASRSAYQEELVRFSDAEKVELIPVAIKVLHPKIRLSVERDVNILKGMAVFMTFCVPSLRWVSLPECVEEFRVVMLKQTDLRYEAWSLEKFVENFADNPNIRFPMPIRPYVKAQVLVETWEDGLHMSDFIGEKTNPWPEGLREKLAKIGLEAVLHMVFRDNFVHGDLHPGNILVQNFETFSPDAESHQLNIVDVCDTLVVNVREVKCPIRLIFLDPGIRASINPQLLPNFKAVFTAVIQGNGEEVADLLLAHATSHQCPDIDKFKQEMSQLIMKASDQAINLGNIKVAELLGDVFRTMLWHKVKMESNFASVILAIMVVEGLGRSLDSNVDLLEMASPILT